MFLRSCVANPASLFVHEQVQASTLCQIRKSRAVTRGMRSFPLLLSAALRPECLYVCERERRNQRDGREREEKMSLRAETKGQISLHAASSFSNSHVSAWTNAACASSQISEGCLLSSHQGSHDSNKLRYSCRHGQAQLLCSMTVTQVELCHHFRPESIHPFPLD